MFEKSRCVFCNRITDKEDIMFRYPSNYGKVAEDHQYTCMQRAHNIVRKNDCVMPLVYFRPDSNELNGSNKEGSYSVFVKDGTELTQMICPTCHGMLFRDTDDSHRNTYLFFGEKDSGKTSLIYAIIYNGVIRKEHPMTIDGRYIPFYNNYLMPKEQLERTYNDIVRSKITKPKSLDFPFIIHRAAAAHSGLTNKTDVFYDVTDFDIQDGNHIDMTLRQAQQATAFVFTIGIGKILCDEGMYYGRDVQLRNHMMSMYYATQYTDSKPVVFIAVTGADMIDYLFDEETIEMAKAWQSSPDIIFRSFFEIFYPLTCDFLKNNFSDYRFCFTSIKPFDEENQIDYPEMTNQLYWQLTELTL